MMPEQPGLFARSRRTDPVSSKEAEAKMNQGRAAAQAMQVLEMLRCHPGLTAKDYDVLLGVREVARKRLPELRKRGLARSEIKVSKFHGRRLQHWYPSQAHRFVAGLP